MVLDYFVQHLKLFWKTNQYNKGFTMGYRARNGKYYSRKESRSEYYERKAREARRDEYDTFVKGAIGVVIAIVVWSWILGI